jgi:hypothetical protein
MTYHATERWGASEDEPSEQRLRELLAQLDADDPEHFNVSLTHESGWTLSLSDGGLLTWENVEEDSLEPRHMEDVSRERTLAMWLKLAAGDIDAIEREPWKPGYNPPTSDEERAELVRAAAASTLASLREFYDQLEPERPGTSCRHDGCGRGAMPLSVFCRAHHYEDVFKTPCPF